MAKDNKNKTVEKYITRNFIRMLQWVGHVAQMGKTRNIFSFRWKDNFKMVLKETQCEMRLRNVFLF
jgi:hypothetical protein